MDGHVPWWTRRQFVQIWLSTILTTCRHSTECATWRVFQQDRIHHSGTEQRWVYDCPKIFSWHWWILPPKTWTRPLWHRSLLPSWCARQQRWETHRWLRVVRRLWSWPWDEDQEISWIQLPWIQSSWHPRQPSKTSLMKKFKNLPWRLILKYNNGKTSAEILLNKWSLILLTFVQENMCFRGKEIRSKLRRPLDTVDLEEIPDSRERAGAPVLWLTCEGQIDVCEMFSDNSHLSAVLDRQGLQVAALIDLRASKAAHFSPLMIQGFWQKLKRKNPKWIFHYLGNLLRPLELIAASREGVVPTEQQVGTALEDCISRAKVTPSQAPPYRQHALTSDFLDIANLSIQEGAALDTNWIKDRFTTLRWPPRRADLQAVYRKI